ncbi:hypothetical protein PG997_007905 [Apiospora hydei]|uniref:Uncharacterized protein n=1 Tax=Apiospora hydei TaxID=1337664 RepID=A0ABR1W9D1_9PEZI
MYKCAQPCQASFTSTFFTYTYITQAFHNSIAIAPHIDTSVTCFHNVAVYLISLSLWAVIATAGHASIGSASTQVSNNSSPVAGAQTASSPTPIIPGTTLASRTTFAISTITTSHNANATSSATAPGAEDALIYVRCDRFRINEGKDAQHGNIWLDAY